MRIRVTYYLDVMSSWCLWAEPAWAELRACCADRPVSFDWRIALLDHAGLPVSRSQCDWFYRRSGTITGSPVMLSSAWLDPAMDEYLAPNLLAEAVRDFGVSDDRARLALARAALLDGQRVGNWAVATSIAARAAGVDGAALEARACAPEVEARVRASTAEFHGLKVTQRPAFVLESDIGDRAVFSGLYKAAPLRAALDAMLADAAAYASWAAHFGPPPSA
jgi:predicted DsbA family dithiol-disulfide isomerase